MISSKLPFIAAVASLALLGIVSFSSLVLTQRLAGGRGNHLSDNDLYQVIDNNDREGAPGQADFYNFVRGATQSMDADPDSAEVDLREPQEDNLIDALTDQLLLASQQQRQSNDNSESNEEAQINKKQDDGSEFDEDSEALGPNSHWPATGLESESGWTLSQPVNDPAEFEAKIGQLTGELNRNMPNTPSRQVLLMGLVNQSTGPDVDALELMGTDLNSIDQLERAQLISALSRLVGDDQRAERRGESDENNDSESTTDDVNGQETSTRYTGSEYMDGPLALASQHFVQGGAGEGRQLLGPDGTFENVQVIKSDTAIPSYCDPPNPCPIGYTAKDGCLEEFVNLASFSREYQAKQKCSCDNEHSLFNCASPMSSSDSDDQQQKQQQQQHDAPKNLIVSQETSASSNDVADDDGNDEAYLSPSFATTDKLATLARTIQNRFGNLASVQRLIGKQQQQQQQKQQQLGDETLDLAGNDDEHSDYLVRSARKLSSLDMHHKVDLD